jgi:uncharacterized repeat protein (TIGR01451 family)
LHTISVNKRIIIAGMVVLLMAACALIMPVDAVVAADAAWEEYSGPVYDPATGRAYYPCVIYDANQFGGHGPAAYYKMWFGGYPGGHLQAVVYSDNGIWWDNAEEMQDITTGGYHAQVVYVPGGYVADTVRYYYKIWYWDGPNMDYLIDDMHTADSVDGVNWVNDQGVTQDATYPLISGLLGTDWKRGTYGPVCVFYNPSAANSGGDPFNYSFTMYYDATTGGQEVVGLAYSTDGNLWVRYGDDPVLDHGAPGDWDSGFATFGTVIKESEYNWHFWYSGGQAQAHDGIGYASSVDGINWSKDAGNPLISKNDGVLWRDTRTYTPSVLHSPTKFDGNGGSSFFKMWFSGVTATPSSNYVIGYMSSLDPELVLAKTASPPGEVQPGQEITYTLTVDNTGSATAQGTVLTDAVPLNTTYVSGST